MNKIIPRPDTVHHAQEVDDTGKHLRWVGTPGRKEKNRKETSKFGMNEILIFHNMDVSKEFCFFCGRIKEQLGDNETLTIDHIVELVEGGKDELGNLQIFCSACHQQKNWSTLYLRKHLGKFYRK